MICLSTEVLTAETVRGAWIFSPTYMQRKMGENKRTGFQDQKHVILPIATCEWLHIPFHVQKCVLHRLKGEARTRREFFGKVMYSSTFGAVSKGKEKYSYSQLSTSNKLGPPPTHTPHISFLTTHHRGHRLKIKIPIQTSPKPLRIALYLHPTQSSHARPTHEPLFPPLRISLFISTAHLNP